MATPASHSANAKEVFRTLDPQNWAVGENILRAAIGLVRAVLFTEIGYEQASWVQYADNEGLAATKRRYQR